MVHFHETNQPDERLPILEASGARSAESDRSARATREVRRNTALRQGRTCYDHLAGVAGVQLFDDLLERGWIKLGDRCDQLRPSYRLTPVGNQRLNLLGVDIASAGKARRRFAFGCLDWTERRVHLGGALGAATLEAICAAGFIRRQVGTRAVLVQRDVTEWSEHVHAGLGGA